MSLCENEAAFLMLYFISCFFPITCARGFSFWAENRGGGIYASCSQVVVGWGGGVVGRWSVASFFLLLWHRISTMRCMGQNKNVKKCLISRKDFFFFLFTNILSHGSMTIL